MRFAEQQHRKARLPDPAAHGKRELARERELGARGACGEKDVRGAFVLGTAVIG